MVSATIANDFFICVETFGVVYGGQLIRRDLIGEEMLDANYCLRIIRPSLGGVDRKSRMNFIFQTA